MIELIPEMMLSGIIDQRGKLQLPADHPRMGDVAGEPAYILAHAEETAMAEDLVFAESDIDNLLRSKAAVYAGFTVLLNQVGLTFDMVERVIITGGFGQYLDIEKSIALGLLPDIEREKFQYHGNSSIGGAYMALLSDAHRQSANVICNAMTYLDFSTNTSFMDEFTSAQFLPHTQMESFPTVMTQLRETAN
jgi:uncharacterized 2Fe-2S/4Fe-4S cluster protein (DUF4445 family)